jgi:hypothetical protein
MNANVRLKYVGENEEVFTTDKVYQVIAFVGTGQPVLLTDANTFGPVNLNADWELVSVTYPGEVTLFPGA